MGMMFDKDVKMSGPRICFITDKYPPDMGGASSSASRIVKQLMESGFQVQILVTNSTPSAEAADYSVDTSSRVLRVSSESQHLYRAMAYLHAQTPFFLIHCYCSITAPVLSIFSLHSQIPLVTNINIEMLSKCGKRNSANFLQSSAWIIADSTSTLAIAQKIANIANRISVISNHLEVSPEKTWDLTGDNRGCIGYVGTLSTDKIRNLFSIYSLLEREYCRSISIIGAVDSYTKNLGETQSFLAMSVKKITAKGIPVNCTFVQKTSVYECMRRCHILIDFASNQNETNSLLEAYALGVPILRLLNTPECTLEQNEDHYISVSMDNPKKAAEVIKNLMDSDQIANQMSQNSRRYAAQFSAAIEQEKYSRICGELLEIYYQSIYGI